jgi:DNA-directed RNA polymerase specialized sigma24 family protein
MTTNHRSSEPAAIPAWTEKANPRGVFVTTHWSVVLSAAHGDDEQATAALARLCQTYWYPLYAYARLRGFSVQDAQDLTQDFFMRLLAGNAVASVSPNKGRFRSFLLASMNHFMTDEWRKAQAQKRGGWQVITLDFAAMETQYLQQAVDNNMTPEKAFEQR